MWAYSPQHPRPRCPCEKPAIRESAAERSPGALAAKRGYPVFADGTLELFDTISNSAEARRTQVLLSPEDDLGATQATVEAIMKE